MPKKIEWEGKRVGRVTIIDLAKPRSETSGGSKWNCLCDCGKKFTSWAISFKRGDTFECQNCRMERKRGIDLTGRKFGRWTVLHRVIGKHKQTAWAVRCDCGNLGQVDSYNLGKKGRSMSCGCLGRKEKSRYVNETLYPPLHRTSTTRCYACRVRIIHSCYKPSHPAYKNFGAKGFTVCELWRNGAEDFFNWCMQNGWKPNHVIAIKDGETVFSAENCYIVEEGEHIRERLTKKITLNGVTKTSREWADESPVSYKTIHNRILKGYNIEDAIFAKSHKYSGTKSYPDEKIKELYQNGMSRADIGRELGFPYTTISRRLKYMGVKPDLKLRRKYKSKNCIKCQKQFVPKCSNHSTCDECKNRLQKE